MYQCRNCNPEVAATHPQPWAFHISNNLLDAHSPPRMRPPLNFTETEELSTKNCWPLAKRTPLLPQTTRKSGASGGTEQSNPLSADALQFPRQCYHTEGQWAAPFVGVCSVLKRYLLLVAQQRGLRVMELSSLAQTWQEAGAGKPSDPVDRPR